MILIFIFISEISGAYRIILPAAEIIIPFSLVSLIVIIVAQVSLW